MPFIFATLGWEQEVKSQAPGSILAVQKLLLVHKST